MENIKTRKESIEWKAFKVFLLSMVVYGTILIAVVISG
jgi:hypothetical protein